jgi:hypothetical protein
MGCNCVDELLLLAMLMVQFITALPVIALTKLVGIIFLVIYSLGIFVSFCLACSRKFRICCTNFANYFNEYGIFFFLLGQIALLSIISYSVYMFTHPFVKGHDFPTFCKLNKLSENLSRTGCDKLQGKQPKCSRYFCVGFF